jgi:hypothetical protein
MTRFYTLTLSTLCAVSLGMCIAGCGNQPVAHTNMTPNEIAATAFAATCQGAPLADLAFAAVGVFNPTIIDADARTWEASAYAGPAKTLQRPSADRRELQAGYDRNRGGHQNDHGCRRRGQE